MMRYENFIEKYRWWIIIIPLIITVIAAIPLLNSRINPDIKSYLPEDTPAIVSKAKIDEIFGDSDPIILIFETNDVLNENTLKRLKNLSRALNRSKEFDGVVSLFDTKNIKGAYGSMIVDPVVKRIPKTDQDREKLRESIRANELAYKLVVSEDFTKAVIILKVAKEISDEQSIDIINTLLNEFDGDEKVYKGGTPYLRVHLYEDTARDMLILMSFGMLIMVLFLIFSFREWKGVILPFLVVIMSIAISLGFFPLMGWELSIITILAPIMMIAIANNYGVHFIARYQELNADHPDWSMIKITKEVLMKLKIPVIVTGLTTIAGILGLVVHILLPAQQLGIAAALGIAFALLLSISFLPAFMMVLKKGKPIRSVSKNTGFINNILSRLAAFSSSKPWIVILIFGSFLLLASGGIKFLHVDSNSENFLPGKHPFRQATSVTNENFGGTKYLTVLFEGDIKDPELLHRLDRYETELKKEPLIGNVTSIASVIRIMSRALNDPGDSNYNKIPSSRDAVAQYLEFYSMSGDPEDFEDLVNFDYTRALLMIQFRADSKNALDEIVAKVEHLTEDDPNRSIVGGFCLVDKELSEGIVNGQYNSLVFAIIIIALLLILIFRSFTSGFLGVLPLIYTIITLFGTMGWLGIKLDMATAMLSSIAIGVGVDYTIHFFWRLKQELASGKTYKEAIHTTLTTTGRGISINALTVVSGFAILFVSSFLTIQYFGFLIIFSVLICLLCAMILMPSLCIIIKPKFLNSNHKVMKIKTLLVVAGLLASILSYSQDAREITKKANDITRLDAIELTSTLKIYDAKGRERVRQTASAYKKFGDVTKSITRFTSPADIKGTGILIYDYDNRDDDMWIYMPALRKTRRIVSSDKGKSYMGSEFSNADMSLPSLDDFTYKLLGSEIYEGKDCWKIEATPVNDDIADNNGYSKRVSLVEKSTYFNMKNTFFDFDDVLFKEILVGRYDEVDKGKYIIRSMEANNLDNGRRSVMTIDKFQKGSSLSESSFAPSALEK
jgi:uncharacterized protein